MSKADLEIIKASWSILSPGLLSALLLIPSTPLKADWVAFNDHSPGPIGPAGQAGTQTGLGVTEGNAVIVGGIFIQQAGDDGTYIDFQFGLK